MSKIPRTTIVFFVAALAVPAIAQDLLVSARFSNEVLRYDADTGAFKGVFSSGKDVKNPNGLAVGPDGNLYIGLGDEGTVLRVDGQTGAVIDRFVFNDPSTPEDETGGLTGCRAIKFGPDGNLYVAAGPNDAILRYDGKTGHFLGVAAKGGGLSGPVGLAIDTDGTLYVGGALDNALHIYRDGQQLRACRAPTLHGTITGVALGPDHLLYAATSARNTVIRFRPETCESLGVFASGMNGSVYLTFDASGNLIVGSFNDDSVYKFDGKTGASLGSFITPGSGGLSGTHDFAFVPAKPSITTTPAIVLPGLAHVPGSSGSFFKTSTWLTNPTDQPITARLRFRPGAGFGQAGAVDPDPLIIAPHTTQSYDDVLSDAFHATTNTGGVAVIELAEGSPLPLVTSRTFNDTAGGTFGQYIEGVPLTGGPTPASWIDGLAGDAANRSNIGVTNLSDAAINVTVTLWNAAGTQIGHDVPMTAPARSSIQVGGIQTAAGLGDTAEFSVRGSANDAPYALYASKIDNVTSDPIYIVPLAARTRQWIDGVGILQGIGGTLFRSSLSLANHGSSTAHVHVAYTVRGDNAPSRSKDVILAASQTLFYRDVLTELIELGGTLNSVGSLSITSDVSVVAWARTYSDHGAAGTLGQFIPAFGTENLIGPRGVILQGLSENAAFRTNFGGINVTTDAVTMTVKAFGSDGAQLAQHQFVVGPQQAMSVGLILASLGVAPIANAYLKVDSSEPSAIYVWASSVDNASTDQTFVRPLPLP